MYIYDPVLSSTEETALEELGFTYIHHNEVHVVAYLHAGSVNLTISTHQLCRRRAEVPMLFYMPHCGRAMYNNLLWANWSPQLLAKMALIGNSFHSYIER